MRREAREGSTREVAAGRQDRGSARDRCRIVRRRHPHRPRRPLRLRRREPSSGPTSRRTEAPESARLRRGRSAAAAQRRRGCRRGTCPSRRLAPPSWPRRRGDVPRAPGRAGPSPRPCGPPFKLLLFALGLAVGGASRSCRSASGCPAGSRGCEARCLGSRRHGSRTRGGCDRRRSERLVFARSPCLRAAFSSARLRFCSSRACLVLSLSSSRARFFSSRSRFLRSFGVSVTADDGGIPVPT